jgi:hypothetical protein
MLVHMSARSHVLATAGIAVTVVAGRAQEAPRRLAGLVEVPAAFNRFTPDGSAMPAEKHIELRARPVPDGAVVATVSEPNQLESREYDYEESGAVAYARDGEWTLVKISGGVAGWLAPQDAGTYHSLESLLQEHNDLAELTDAWEGSIRPSAGNDARNRVPLDPDRNVIGFLEPTAAATTLLPIFERADRRSAVVARVATGNPGRTLRTTGDFPYEVIVLDRQPGWFRVARAEQIPGEIEPAWLPDSPVWRYHQMTNDAERRALGRRAWGPDNPDDIVTMRHRQSGGLAADIPSADESNGRHDNDSISRISCQCRRALFPSSRDRS